MLRHSEFSLVNTAGKGRVPLLTIVQGLALQRPNCYLGHLLQHVFPFNVVFGAECRKCSEGDSLECYCLILYRFRAAA